MSSDPLTTLGTADRNRLEALLVEFDLGWAPDRLPAAVEQLPVAGHLRAAGLRELVRIDMERHARRGHPVALDEYAARFPELLETGAGLSPGAPADEPTRPLAGPPNPPEVFGRYRIVRPLGRGGMGSVYLARDTELDRLVALKVPHLRPDDPDAAERFAREARAAATIDHPNVCRVYDVGRIDGLPFLTMAYVDGRTLADEVRAAPLPPRRAVEVIRDVARGMAEAHRRGVVHRDLKPANILMGPDGRPVVTDFGLARRDADDLRLTTSGAVLGTPLYMAPEQVTGETDRVGPASDVYSLGVVLYELLAGRPPFGLDRAAVMAGTLSHDPPAPSSVRREVDPRLDAVVLRAMAKRPADRPTMSEFAAALDAWLENDRPRPIRRPRTHLVAAGVVAVLLLLILPAGVKLGWFGGPRGPVPDGKKGEDPFNGGRGEVKTGVKGGPDKHPTGVRPLAGAPLPAGAEGLLAVGLSPDGRQVYTAEGADGSVMVRRWDAAAGRAEAVVLPAVPGAWAAFGPDGRHVLVGGRARQTGLYALADGAVVRQFDTGPAAHSGAVARGGRHVIVGLDAGPAGHRVRVYAVAKERSGGEYAGHGEAVTVVALSDDAQWAYSAGPKRDATWDVRRSRRVLGQDGNTVRCAVFLPGTSRVAVANGHGRLAVFDPQTPNEALHYSEPHAGAVTTLAVTPDGKLLVSGGDDRAVRAWDPAKDELKWTLADLPAAVTALAVSADGRRLTAGFGDKSWRTWELPAGP